MQNRAEGAAEAEAHTWHTGKNTWIFYGFPSEVFRSLFRVFVKAFVGRLLAALKKLALKLFFKDICVA